VIKFLKTVQFFLIPISAFLVSLMFTYFYFFSEGDKQKSLVLAICGYIASVLWFRSLYKGYKLMKAEEKGIAPKETQKITQAQQLQGAKSPAARYWKRFMWVVIILFIIGIIIRYFLGVYRF